MYSPHTLVTFGGECGPAANGVRDIWQCGIRGVQPAGDIHQGAPLSDCDAYLSGIHAALLGWWDATGSVAKFPNDATLKYVKANNIGADGKYIDPTTHEYDYTETPGGGAAEVPSILSVCISFTTARRRPPGAFGRIYLPNYSAVPVSPGSMQVDSTNQGLWLTKGHDLLTLLTNVSAGYGTGVVFAPCVVSKRDASVNGITGVRVGDVFDVQRRRKNAFRETYVSTSFP